MVTKFTQKKEIKEDFQTHLLLIMASTRGLQIKKEVGSVGVV